MPSKIEGKVEELLAGQKTNRTLLDPYFTADLDVFFASRRKKMFVSAGSSFTYYIDLGLARVRRKSSTFSSPVASTFETDLSQPCLSFGDTHIFSHSFPFLATIRSGTLTFLCLLTDPLGSLLPDNFCLLPSPFCLPYVRRLIRSFFTSSSTFWVVSTPKIFCQRFFGI